MAERRRRSCAWAAWRCATGCSSTGRRTGPPPCAPADGIDRRRARGPSRGCAGASTRVPGVRGVIRLGEAMAVIPLVKRGAARGAAAVPGRARWSARRRPPPSPAPRCASARAAACAGEAAVAALSVAARARRAARRRRRRLPRRGAQGDRRLRGRRRGRARRAEGARPLRLAPDGAAARRQPRGRGDAATRARAATPLGHGAALSSASVGAAVEVFAWSERHADIADRESPAPPGPRAAARGRDTRADGGPARRRAGRAGGDPARRGPGLTQDPVHPASSARQSARAARYCLR